MHLRGRLRRLIASLPQDYWFLWLGTLINRLGGFVSPFLALYLTGERGASVANASFIVALFGAGSFAAALVGGELADRLGRRPVMLLSFLTAPVAMMVVGLVRDVRVIAVCTVVLGFATDLYRPAVSAAVTDLVPAGLRTRAYGYLYWVINVGAAIAPVAAGLMARVSYLPLFIGDAATTLVYGMIVLWRISESRPTVLAGPTAPAEAAAVPSLPVRPEEPGSRRRGGDRLRQRSAGGGGRLSAVLRDPLLLMFTGLSLFSGLVYSQGYSTLPIDMRAHAAGPAQYGLAIAVNGLVIVLLGIPASNSSVRWPRVGAMALAAFLTAIGFGMNALFHTLPFYILSVVVWTLGEIAASSVAPSIIADLAPVRLRGLYQGIYGSSWGLAFFAGPALGGLTLQRFGSATLWTSCLILGMLVSVGYLSLRKAAGRRVSAAKGLVWRS